MKPIGMTPREWKLFQERWEKPKRSSSSEVPGVLSTVHEKPCPLVRKPVQVSVGNATPIPIGVVMQGAKRFVSDGEERQGAKRPKMAAADPPVVDELKQELKKLLVALT